MADFRIPPISTLVGSTLPNFFRVLNEGRVDPGYYHKVFLSTLVCLISNAFMPWERYRENYQQVEIRKPIFILGHWRSGTTLLHNFLCKDPNMSFITTYQSLFPHNMYSKWLFKSFVRWKIPDKRPTDEVDLGANLPQEDDFAMTNITSAFYEFFFFPENYRKLYDQHISFTKNRGHKEEWLAAYDYLIKKALVNRQGDFPVLKNPANTGRLDVLFSHYPDARFVHIFRNPVLVYLSTKNFFLSLFPTVQLQKTSHQQIVNLIVDLYGALMRDYLDKKPTIPTSQLVEIRFEEFEKDPLSYLSETYSHFDMKQWPQVMPIMKSYCQHLRDYKKNVYSISKTELERITKEWSFAFKVFNYDVPENLEITDA